MTCESCRRFLGCSITLLALITLCGCSGKKDAATELADTVKTLEKPSDAPQASPTANVNQALPPPSQQVNAALTSFKAGNYSDAIVNMEKARTNPNKTPQQMMAVQDAIAAVMRDLYARAAKGDVAAQQAIKQYQEERTKH